MQTDKRAQLAVLVAMMAGNLCLYVSTTYETRVQPILMCYFLLATVVALFFVVLIRLESRVPLARRLLSHTKNRKKIALIFVFIFLLAVVLHYMNKDAIGSVFGLHTHDGYPVTLKLYAFILGSFLSALSAFEIIKNIPTLSFLTVQSCLVASIVIEQLLK